MLRWLCVAVAALIAQLAVADRVTLSVASNGIDGELQLLEDARVTPSLLQALWGSGDAPDDMAHAALRLVKRDGTIADTIDLERPLARLERAHLYGHRRDRGRDTETYLVTVDHSTGAGSYAGPITSFVEVSNGRVTWLDATDINTGATERMRVMRSLKTVWQIVPARDGAGQDILEARCRPAPGPSADVQFVVSYCRYSFNGTHWVRRVREEKGFSDFETGFPDRRLFP